MSKTLQNKKTRKGEKKMADKDLTIRISGKVVKSFYDREKNKFTLGIGISTPTADAVENILTEYSLEYQGDYYPIKQLDDGRLFFQASSRFLPEIAGISEEDYVAIGVDSEVTIYAKLKSGRAMRKKYVAAYITAIRVTKFVEYTRDSVFESTDVLNLDGEITEVSETN